ncbi:MAG: type IV toxin-antitoxin system AbiEi family antitoxin domain-containing protein [Cyclobacteriaceae bacterium]|nr:type IV toxin-antitoxin system AbiEi family antitoxin domain-containing protein [Cyclobacteriaceae bacterium]
MQSIEKQIEKSIKSKPRGHLVMPDDYLTIGSSEAIRKALDRLEDKKIIIRVAHGIYVRPKISKLIGPLTSSAEEVAEAIAKRDRIRTVPTGSYALNALGFSTQVPMNIVLLTDGSPREIKVGKQSIKFKKTTPKNLLAKGKISRLVIQALKEIGNGKVSEEEERKILDLLRKEELKDLKHDIALAPVWIQKIMKKALTDGKD